MVQFGSSVKNKSDEKHLNGRIDKHLPYFMSTNVENLLFDHFYDLIYLVEISQISRLM